MLKAPKYGAKLKPGRPKHKLGGYDAPIVKGRAPGSEKVYQIPQSFISSKRFGHHTYS